MPPLYSASTSMYRAPRLKRAPGPTSACPPIQEMSLGQSGEFLTVSFFAGDVHAEPDEEPQPEEPQPEEPRPETPRPDADAPVDFFGRVLTSGDVVEFLKTLYRSQGEDVKVVAGWRGVIARLDADGDALVDFGDERAKRWIRRKHLGSLKKPEDHELLEIYELADSYSSPGATRNAAFLDGDLLEDQCSPSLEFYSSPGSALDTPRGVRLEECTPRLDFYSSPGSFFDADPISVSHTFDLFEEEPPSFFDADLLEDADLLDAELQEEQCASRLQMKSQPPTFMIGTPRDCSPRVAKRKSVPMTYKIGTPRECSPAPEIRSRRSC